MNKLLITRGLIVTRPNPGVGVQNPPIQTSSVPEVCFLRDPQKRNGAVSFCFLFAFRFSFALLSLCFPFQAAKQLLKTPHN